MNRNDTKVTATASKDSPQGAEPVKSSRNREGTSFHTDLHLTTAPPMTKTVDEIQQRLRWPYYYVDHHAGMTASQLKEAENAVVAEAKQRLYQLMVQVIGPEPKGKCTGVDCPGCNHGRQLTRLNTVFGVTPDKEQA